MRNKVTKLLASVFALIFSVGAIAQDSNYLHVGDDLSNGMPLQEIADRAFENADTYWENAPDADRDGDDTKLSAGEAVTQIYSNAVENRDSVDPAALDIVSVAIAVIESYPNCEDTFDAVRAAVALLPGRADEIIANVAVKRDCNCSNGGLWVDARLDDRIRVAMRHSVLDVPIQCSCSQVAMFGGISGLPENREFSPDMDEAEKAELTSRMVERVTIITERTSALQNKNDWACGCANVNLAASMQGIKEAELRDATYDGLAEKYAEDAGDTGMVVDSFGIVGLHPMEHWGEDDIASRNNSLRRKPEVYRGDNLILDPFHPATEFIGQGDQDFSHVSQHSLTSGQVPSDVFISEYLEGWNEASLMLPAASRDPEQRNRMVELHNGTDRTIDLGNDQYLLEIYAAPGTETITVESPPMLVRKTIALESDVTFDFDKSDIRPEADGDLRNVIKILNDVDLFSEVLVIGHTCDIGTDEYNRGLSMRRAESVKAFLVAQGLNASIRTEGHGELEPRVPNTSIATRSLNRRIELSFVTKEGEVLAPTVVRKAENGVPERREYTFSVPATGSSVSEVSSESVENLMANGEYYKGDMKPRQVIGLNGAIEPGASHVIVFSDSDEALRSSADQVTRQLDFKPNETLVVRRLGGEMTLNCRAQCYSYVTNYPAVPPTRLPGVDDFPLPPPPPPPASPN